MVEERGRSYGLLALRPAEAIPPEVTEAGCNVGHALFGSANFEVIHFVFEFYGFQTSNVLINPNNPLVQTVLRRMRDDGESFFCALEATGRVTTFRTAIGQDTDVLDLWPLGESHLPEIHLFGIDFSIAFLMNVLWIAALATFVLIEKVVPAGVRVSRGTGILLTAWGYGS